MDVFNAFVTCPKHIELLLKDELIELGATEVTEGLSGVHASASAETWMKIIMWTRLANRVYLKIDSVRCANKKDLYDGNMAVKWSSLCQKIPSTLSIKFNGTNQELKNTHFSSQVT
jgi:23S rRNA (guanine2445-N2)-methyltransferase / 23S rRNA (guanine2069-N7)-methyltransferase